MGENQNYSIDFKLQAVGKHEQGKCGYKRLAREFNLSRIDDVPNVTALVSAVAAASRPNACPISDALL